MAKAHPSLHGIGCEFDPIFKLLASKQNDGDWNSKLRAMLRSVIANRQSPHARCHQAGWVEHAKCIFCLHGEVTGEPMVAKMPDTDKQHHAAVSGATARDERADRGMQADDPVRATQEQIDRAPNGTLAHRNYLCPALHVERQQRAPARMMKTAASQAQGNLAYERGLLPSIAHTVPPPGGRSHLPMDRQACGRGLPRPGLLRRLPT